jgi:hypothetical protein
VSLKTSDLIDKAFWSLLLGVCSFGTHNLAKLSESVSSLNEKMAVMIYKTERQEQTNIEVKDELKSLGRRIDFVEKNRVMDDRD